MQLQLISLRFSEYISVRNDSESVSFIIVLLLRGITLPLPVSLSSSFPKIKGDYLAITTLGFAEIIRVIIQSMEVIGASQGIQRRLYFENGVKPWIPPICRVFLLFLFSTKYTNFFSGHLHFVALIIYFINNLRAQLTEEVFLPLKMMKLQPDQWESITKIQSNCICQRAFCENYRCFVTDILIYISIRRF